MAKGQRHKTKPKLYDPSLYTPRGPQARASSAQLWRLNRHDGYLARALQLSGGQYVQADVAHQLVAELMAEMLPNEHQEL